MICGVLMLTENSTLEKIQSAAEAEFSEKGFKSASLRNIVKTAGVTTGAFYGYYNSKEELFGALVKEAYDYVLDTFKRSLREFDELPDSEKPKNMGKAGGNCIKEILAYAYSNKSALRLILLHSDGTEYSGMVDKMVELEVEATHRCYDTLRRLGHEVPHIDERLEHILVTGMMNACFEMVIHDMSFEKAEKYLEELNAFYTAGWLKIMGQ